MNDIVMGFVSSFVKKVAALTAQVLCKDYNSVAPEIIASVFVATGTGTTFVVIITRPWLRAIQAVISDRVSSVTVLSF